MHPITVTDGDAGGSDAAAVEMHEPEAREVGVGED